MRALVAESNVVTRVSLRRILERAGFAVDELRDELAAACLLHQPDPPELVMIALDTLLADFGAVCGSIRAAKPSVYVVALVPESRRIEVPSVLESGADDFMIKPVSLQEADGRIQVIRRIVEAGIAVRPHARSAQGDLPGKRTSVARLLKDLTSPAVLTDVFSHMGLAPVEIVRPDEAGGRAAFSTWAPALILHDESAHWLNVRLDLDEANAPVLFGAVERYGDFSEDRLLDLLRQLMGLTQDVIQSYVQRSEGAQLYIPVAPVAGGASDVPRPDRLSGPMADETLIGLRLRNELRFLMTVTIEPVRREEPPIGRVRKMDVLAKDVQSADYQIMLLRAGTMLSDAYIRKIQAFVHSKNLAQKVEVFRPPDATVDFLETLVRSA